MKKLISIILSITMIFSFAACSGAEEKLTWQEQYDLGLRYLTELEYDSAIQSFNEAIKIDPKQTPAYVALAGVYYEQGDNQKATETIDTAISAAGSNNTLEQIKQQIENNSLSVSDTIDRVILENSIVKTEKTEAEDGSYVIEGFDKNKNLIKETFFNEDGIVSGSVVSGYNEKGIKTKETRYDSNGIIYAVADLDEKGNVIKYTYYNDDGSISDWEVFEYDANNNCIARIPYNSDGGISDSWWGYRYDDKGHCTLETLFFLSGAKEEYEYDINGNLIKEISYNIDGSIYYINEYNDHGNLVKDIWYNANDSIDHWGVHEYDENGKEIRVTVYNADGSVFQIREYYENGNRSITYYNADGSISQIVEIGENNNIEKAKIYEDGYLYLVIEYDKNENPVKETYYNSDGTIWAVYER